MPYVNGIYGNIVNDITLKQTPKGTLVANFTIANNTGFGDNKRTDFINCVAFSKTAEIIDKFCKKGVSIFVEGTFQNNPYQEVTSSNGKKFKAQNWEYIVRSVIFTQKPKQDSSAEEVLPSTPIPNLNDFKPIVDADDDLPF